jgi:3-oxoacyl-[acyl-carrier-protein] synthase-3
LDGPGIYDFALKRVPDAINKFMKKNNLNLNQINHFIFHQANEFIIKSLQRKLGIPDSKIHIEMKNTGNTASSSIPIVLSKNFNKILPGKNILLIGFGGGLSWGVSLIKKNV